MQFHIFILLLYLLFTNQLDVFATVLIHLKMWNNQPENTQNSTFIVDFRNMAKTICLIHPVPMSLCYDLNMLMDISNKF